VKFDARGAVGGPAAQVSFVLNLDGDHTGWWWVTRRS
jgi:hypothetical protein